MQSNFTFPKDRPDMTSWYYFQDAFTPSEFDFLEDMLPSIPYQAARIASNVEGKELVKYRKSNIKWIRAADSAGHPMHRHHWLFDKLMHMMEIANNELWNFNLQSLTDDIQYTEYLGDEEGFYDWHLDLGPDELSLRKVSLVVLLSDPSEYEGGELQLKRGKDEISVPNDKGNVILFPSYILHRVTPVTSGLRKSLVLWGGGESLK